MSKLTQMTKEDLLNLRKNATSGVTIKNIKLMNDQPIATVYDDVVKAISDMLLESMNNKLTDGQYVNVMQYVLKQMSRMCDDARFERSTVKEFIKYVFFVYNIISRTAYHNSACRDFCRSHGFPYYTIKQNRVLQDMFSNSYEAMVYKIANTDCDKYPHVLYLSSATFYTSKGLGSINAYTFLGKLTVRDTESLRDAVELTLNEGSIKEMIGYGYQMSDTVYKSLPRRVFSTEVRKYRSAAIFIHRLGAYGKMSTEYVDVDGLIDLIAFLNKSGTFDPTDRCSRQLRELYLSSHNHELDKRPELDKGLDRVVFYNDWLNHLTKNKLYEKRNLREDFIQFIDNY